MSKEKILLFVLAAIQFTHIMDFMIMMPLGPQFERIFQINPQQFSMLVSAYIISAGIFSLIGAFFIDRFDRKNALLLSYLGFTIGTFACALSPTYEVLMAARIVTGIFGGTLSSLTFSVVGDAIPNERRAAAMGIVMASFSVASVAGVPMGLFLATHFGWHSTFVLLGIMSTVVLGLLYFYVPSMRGHLGHARQKWTTVITNV
ncbi:MAG: MFS transporter, partial [Bacteroidota bacterium]|nr:MFS transporter [Bacteroidota bacterium]